MPVRYGCTIQRESAAVLLVREKTPATTHATSRPASRSSIAPTEPSLENISAATLSYREAFSSCERDPPRIASPSPLVGEGSKRASQFGVDGLSVFFFEPRDQFGGGDHLADAANALAAAPD